MPKMQPRLVDEASAKVLFERMEYGSVLGGASG
jgi:hypothetical protein